MSADAARDDTPRLITGGQVLDLLRALGRPISATTMYNYRSRPPKGWPQPARYVGRTPLWDRTAIEAYAGTPHPPIDFPPDEEWIELAGYPSYLISTHGRVYSTLSRKILRPLRMRHGAHGKRFTLAVNLRPDQGPQPDKVPLARAVLTSFVGPPPTNDSLPRYEDGNRDNCRLDNLRWGPRERPDMTPERAAALGRQGAASRAATAPLALTPQKLRQARELVGTQPQLTMQEIADAVGCSRATLYRALGSAGRRTGRRTDARP